MKSFFKIFAIAFLFSTTGAKAATTSNFHGMFSIEPFFDFSSFSDVMKIKVMFSPRPYEHHNAGPNPGLKICWKEDTWTNQGDPCSYSLEAYDIDTSEILLSNAHLQSNTFYEVTIKAYSILTSSGISSEPGETFITGPNGILGNPNAAIREVARFKIRTGNIGPRTSQATGSLSPSNP